MRCIVRHSDKGDKLILVFLTRFLRKIIMENHTFKT